MRFNKIALLLAYVGQALLSTAIYNGNRTLTGPYFSASDAGTEQLEIWIASENGLEPVTKTSLSLVEMRGVVAVLERCLDELVVSNAMQSGDLVVREKTFDHGEGRVEIVKEEIRRWKRRTSSRDERERLLAIEEVTVRDWIEAKKRLINIIKRRGVEQTVTIQGQDECMLQWRSVKDVIDVNLRRWRASEEIVGLLRLLLSQVEEVLVEIGTVDVDVAGIDFRLTRDEDANADDDAFCFESRGSIRSFYGAGRGSIDLANDNGRVSPFMQNAIKHGSLGQWSTDDRGSVDYLNSIGRDSLEMQGKIERNSVDLLNDNVRGSIDLSSPKKNRGENLSSIKHGSGSRTGSVKMSRCSSLDSGESAGVVERVWEWIGRRSGRVHAEE